MGRVDQAIVEIRRAAELDPLSPIIATDLGKAMIFARRYDDAITQLNNTLALYPDYSLAHYWLYFAYAEKGDYSKAFVELDKVQTFLGRPRYLAERAFLTARSGDSKKARVMIDDVQALSQREYVNPSAMVYAYTALGDKDQAFAWLERGYREKLPFMGSIKVVPCLDPLRSDPRYSDLTHRLGLPS